MKKRKGLLAIVDGIDGSGKGTIIETLKKWSEREGLKVLDLKKYWQKNHTTPEPRQIRRFQVIVSAEPTFSMIGQAIREEIVRANERPYLAFTTAEAFALDREVLYKRVIIPALKTGKIIFQERGVTTSLVYQPVQEEPLTLKKILALEGNKLTLQYPPDLLIITKLAPEEAFKRLKARHQKRDRAIFERLDFLKKIDKRFRSRWFRKFFSRRGTKVVLLDTSKAIAETQRQAIKIWEEFLRKRPSP